MKYICEQCWIEFFSRKRWDRIIKFCSQKCCWISKKWKPSWNKWTPMSQDTKEKLSTALRNIKEWKHSANYKWWHLSTHWYVLIYHPYHPRSMSNMVYEHILVAEKYLWRFLNKWEIVHHINEIRNDNRPENLYIFKDTSSHIVHHKKWNNILLSNILN